MQRRKFVTTAGLLVAAGLTGCLDGDGEPGDGEGDDNESDNESDDGGDGDDGDDGSESETSADGELFSDVFRFEESYAFEMTSTDEESREMTMTGRFDGENYVMTTEGEGMSGELYVVDDTSYSVMDGECYTGDMMDIDADEADMDYEDDPPEVEPTGTDVVRDRDVYVYDFSELDVEGQWEGVYYVDQETGYLLRIDIDDGRLEFSDWGEVEAVEAPDMECTDMEDSGMGDMDPEDFE